MGYAQPWYSVRGVEAPIGGATGHIMSFLRDDGRVFLTYSTTGRGNEPADTSLGLLDATPYGRREAWEDNPEGWPEGRQACWYWRTDADGVRHPGARPAGPHRMDPPRRDARGDPRPPWRPPLTRVPADLPQRKILGPLAWFAR